MIAHLVKYVDIKRTFVLVSNYDYPFLPNIELVIFYVDNNVIIISDLLLHLFRMKTIDPIT